MARSSSKSKRTSRTKKKSDLPDGGWKKVGPHRWKISNRDMQTALARASKKACARGKHFFARPHRRGPCRCPKRCMDCGISESDILKRQEKRQLTKVRQATGFDLSA